MEMIKLSSGYEIPALGIGPGIVSYGKRSPYFGINILNKIYYKYQRNIGVKLFDNPRYVNAVVSSFNAGYRLIDNSTSYANEKLIGNAIRKSGVNRDELFITTRVSNGQQAKGQIREFLLKSLDDLKLEYIDLHMFHWPVPEYYLKTWDEMIKLKQEGLVRTLGVANCHKHHIEALEKSSGVLPSINQVEVHPLFTQESLIEFCKSKGIQVQSYTPLARNDDRLVRSRLLKELGVKYSKTVQQIVLRWHIEKGLIPIPRSLNKNRQIQNISVFDFKLTAQEIKSIDNMNINSRLRYDPDNCDFSIL